MKNDDITALNLSNYTLNYSIWLCNDYRNRIDIIQWNKSRKNNIKIIIIKTRRKIYACLHVTIWL